MIKKNYLDHKCYLCNSTLWYIEFKGNNYIYFKGRYYCKTCFRTKRIR